MPTYDIAVIGLGAIGSATLYQLAKAGVRAIGIDQFVPPHTLGSSHGETRITRLSVGEGAAYLPLVRRSHQLWREIEAASGSNILTLCGGLIMGPPGAGKHHGVDFVDNTIALAQRHGITHEIMPSAYARRRYPEFAIEPDARAYFEPEAGYLRPENAVAAQLMLAQRLGAEVRVNTRVDAIEQQGNTVGVRTSTGEIEAGRVLISAGAYLKRLLPRAQWPTFRITRQVLHWLPVRTGAHARAPIFIWCYGATPEDLIYGFPSLDGQTIKVASEMLREYDSPEAIEREVGAPEQLAFWREKVQGRLLAATGAPVRSVVCQYTEAPGAQFIIAPHPEMSAVTVASCCSGHGFKHSAALGESLAARLRGANVPTSLDAFAHAWH